MQRTPKIGWEKTPLGVRDNLIKDLPNGNRMVRHAGASCEPGHQPEHPRTRDEAKAQNLRYSSVTSKEKRKRGRSSLG